MDPTDNEQTELLRNIWQQMVAMGRSVNSRIDALEAKLEAKIDGLDDKIDALGTRLDGRIDALDAKITAFTKQTHDNFGRVQRNLDRVALRLDDIEGRLTRVEEFCGLHPVR